MSYIERALGWFLKNKVFAGFRTLRDKQYIGFFIVGVLALVASTGLILLGMTTFIVSMTLMRLAILLETALAIGFFIAGLLIGHTGTKLGYGIGMPIVLGCAFLAYFFLEGMDESNIFKWIRFALLVLWALISTLSMFSLTRSYFTSLASKFIAIGNPQERVFFQPIVRIVAILSVPIFVYILFTPGGGDTWFALLGIIYCVLVLLVLFKIVHVENAETYASIVGYFNIYLFYQLVMAFSETNYNVGALLLDIGVNLFISLYVIQNWTSRVSKLEDLPDTEPAEVPARTPRSDPADQEKPSFGSKAKKVVGEKALVMFAIGMVLGNQAVFLGSYLGSSIALLSPFTTLDSNLPGVYDRVFIICGIFIMTASVLLFMQSTRFQRSVTNSYTYRDVVPLLFDCLRHGKIGERTIAELVLQKLGGGIKGQVQNAGNRIKEKIGISKNTNAGKRQKDEISNRENKED